MSPVLLISKARARRVPLFSCVNALASVCFFSAVAVVLLFCAVVLLCCCSVVPLCGCSILCCCTAVLLFCCSLLFCCAVVLLFCVASKQDPGLRSSCCSHRSIYTLRKYKQNTLAFDHLSRVNTRTSCIESGRCQCSPVSR